LIATIDKTSDELLNYQHHLQDMLAECTKELQLSARNFQKITETSMEGILQLDMDGRLVFTNDAFSHIIGFNTEELKGMSIQDLMDAEQFEETRTLFQKVISGEPMRTEFVLKHKDGNPRFVMSSAVRTELPNQVVITAFVTDITSRKKSENALRDSENRYRTLAETAQVLIIIIDKEDRVEYINDYAAKYLRVPHEEIVGRLRSSLFDSKANEKMSKSLVYAFQGNTLRFNENRFKFPNGHIWLSSSIVPMRDEHGEINSVFIISTDITNVKETQKELLKQQRELEKRVKERTANLEASQEQSRKLARQIVRTQEEERRRVSRELHDEAGQVLVSLKYELASSFQELGQDPDQRQTHYENMMAAIDKTMAQIRQLSHSLRPPTLDVAGINLSLEDYCVETSEHTGLQIDYQGVEVNDLPEEIGISLFRILQEALTNVWKHARASKVKENLDNQDSTVLLSIKDNGKGMAGSAVRDGIGLLGIRERVDILGGKIKIHSQSGIGTQLEISIPWQKDRDG
jgi:PAS domain S-box-containing protein